MNKEIHSFLKGFSVNKQNYICIVYIMQVISNINVLQNNCYNFNRGTQNLILCIGVTRYSYERYKIFRTGYELHFLQFFPF